MSVIISEAVVVTIVPSGPSHWNDGVAVVPPNEAEQVRVYCSPAVLDSKGVFATTRVTVSVE